MNNQMYKLIVTRTDAIVQESIFSGWHGESCGDTYFRGATEDKRTLFAVLMVGQGVEWDVRSQFVRERHT